MDVYTYTPLARFKQAYRWGRRQLYVNGPIILTAAVAAVGIAMCSQNMSCSSQLEIKLSRPEPRTALEYSADAMAPKYSGERE